MSSSSFYTALPVFTEFQDICDSEKCSKLPDDWHIVVTDIEGSTEAIRQGSYRDVNSLGVASILAVLNAVKPLNIPYVFGGDGALLSVPDEVLPQTRQALLGTRRLAKTEFDLSLRVGIVPAATIRKAGYEMSVGKYQASGHYTQAIFRGHGFSFAEQQIKDASNPLYRLELNEQDTADADFSGFECRWKDIPSPHGETVSIIIQAQDAVAERSDIIYSDVLKQIRQCYGRPDQYCPVNKKGLELSVNPLHLRNEIKIRTSQKDASFRKRYQQLLPWKIRLGKGLMALNVKTPSADWGNYKNDLIANSDFRKFDDTLKMVISGTPDQRQQLVDYLEQQYRKGRLVYGLHCASTALITCIVSDYSAGNHIHFIDGSNGGYALAASEMKKRLAR